MNRGSGASAGRGRAARHSGQLGAWWLALALLACGGLHAQSAFHERDVERVVAFGDVHGAFDELTGLLRAAGVIDAQLHWSGGATHLVSVGDLIDRGPRSRDVLDLMMRLETEAAARGGRVHVVLGNHELMNLTGDSRYLTGVDWAAYPEAPDDPARSAAERQLPEGELLSAPTGYFAWQAAFAPDGKYGAWLATRPALLAIDDTLFVHGGISPVVTQLGGLRLNEVLATELPRLMKVGAELRASGALPFGVDLLGQRPDTPEPLAQLVANPVYGPNGPLWYRGNSWCPTALEKSSLTRVLDGLQLARVVVGHTPTLTREVTTRFGGSVIMLDTGLLASYYKGNPRVLVIENGRVHVVTGTSEAGALISQGPDINPPGWSDLDLEAALDSTPVAGVAADGSASFRLRERTVRARFVAGSTGDVANAVSAYRLDRLLGLGMVPVTVAAEWEGERGTLYVEDTRWLSESERATRNLTFENWCAEGHAYQLVRVFDTLIDNRARTAENLSYDFATHRIRLTGHEQAFTNVRRVSGFDPAGLPGALREPLAALDRSALDRIMARGKAKAVLKRRDAMLAPAKEPR